MQTGINICICVLIPTEMAYIKWRLLCIYITSDIYYEHLEQEVEQERETAASTSITVLENTQSNRHQVFNLQSMRSQTCILPRKVLPTICF